MKRFTLLMALCFICSAAWLPTSAQRGANGKNPVTVHADDEVSYNYDPSMPLIVDDTDDEANTQLSSNAFWPIADNHTNSNGYAMMLDGDENTVFQSNYYANVRPHYLQINLLDKYNAVIFTMSGTPDGVGTDYQRHYDQLPTDMTVLVTNTPDDESSWEEVGHFTSENCQIPAHGSMKLFISPVVKGAEAFQYVRIVVNASYTSKYRAGDDFNVAEFQIYEAVATDANLVNLSLLVDSLTREDLLFLDGTDPGFYGKTEAEEYQRAMADAQLALINNHTSEEYKAYFDDLHKALDAVNASFVPMREGYFFFTGARDQIDYSYALAAEPGRLIWKLYDVEDPYQLFRVTKNDAGQWVVQNVGTGQYINTVPGDATYTVTGAVPMTDEFITGQTFTYTKWSQWNIANEANGYGYHGWAAGDGGATYIVVPAPRGLSSQSSWYIHEADQSVVENLISMGQKLQLKDAMESLVKEAQATAALPMLYDALITNAPNDGSGQIKDNCVHPIDSESYGVKHLIDNNLTTYFHSNADPEEPLSTQWAYLQFDLGRDDLTAFFFDIVSRQSYVSTPSEFVIYVTNTPDDEASWTKLEEYSSGFGNAVATRYTSKIINMGGAYRYVRMYVVGTATGQNSFNMSEMQLYSPEVSADAQYYTVEGMKDAVDALNALIAASEEKMANLTVTEADLEALKEATAKVTGLYIDHEAIAAILTQKIEALDKEIKKAFVTGALIKSADQLSSNRGPQDDNPLPHLLDGDVNTVFQSEYQEGGALHTLQADLLHPYSSVYFTMQGCPYGVGTDGKMHYDQLPTDMTVEVTNTPSDESSWREIARLNQNIPARGSMEVYTSPMLTSDETFRHLRITVNASYTATYRSGIDYNVAEFQVFSNAADQSASQYYMTEGLKEVIDEINATVETVKQRIANETARMSDADVLDEAMAKLKDTMLDFTELDQLVSEAEGLLRGITIGSNAGQLSDESYKTALQNAIEKASTTVHNKAELAALVDGVKEALANLRANLNKLDPSKWYYIVNMANENDQSPADGYYHVARMVRGAALYVLSNGGAEGKGDQEGFYHANQQMRWGMDDIKSKGTEGDPDALWRFVPAEDRGEDYYYIQNMRNGFYLGWSNTGTSDIHYYDAAEPYAFKLEYLGESQYGIIAPEDADNPGPIWASDNARQIYGRGGTATKNTRTAWEIQEFVVDEDFPIVLESYATNNIRVMTLPYAVEALADLNYEGETEVHTFAIHSQLSDTEIALVEKDRFEAGEPFVMTVGDYNNYTAGHDPVELFFMVPETLTSEVLKANGLVGNLNRATLQKAGMGYFRDAVLKVTTDNALTLQAQTGYIDPTLIEPQDGDYTMVLTTESGSGALDGVKTLQLKSVNEKADVYSIDGRLLRHNANSVDAKKGLQKGVYIVGKKKVAVK